MLSIHDLTISYKNTVVLSDFQLVLNQGDIFALLGDSGSGKSSALRFIAGLDVSNSGTIELDGNILSANGHHHIAAEVRGVGMVFQDYTLFPHMSVAKNIVFGIKHLNKVAQSARMTELLNLVDLSGTEKKYPHQLSGGEQQRIALARALAPNPKLLLLDEPFSSLDKNRHDSLVMQVRDTLKKSQVTSILVTHDKVEANTFADKIGSIQNKQLYIHH